MSRTKFCQYWPFMTNVWSPNSTHTSKSGDKRSFFFRCRLYAKSVRPVAGGGMRATTRREGHSCPARLTITHFIGPDTFHLARPRDRTNNNAPCPGHTHTLDLLDQTKKNDFIRYICAAEISNGYTPAQIHTTLNGSNGRNPAMELALQEAGGSYLTSQDVRNYGASWLREHRDPRFISASFSVDQQIEEVRSHLLHELAPHWFFEDYEVTRPDSHRARGIVWMKKDRVSTLQRFGTLFLLDATHDTNWLGWQMYTILLRDSVSSWVPAAHILTATQDANVLSRGLVQLKVWCGGNTRADWYGFHSRWDPHYIVTDDSNVEKKAVRDAFPGLAAGGTQPLHLLCKVHFERTIRKHFPGDDNAATRDLLLMALRNNRTKASCLQSLEAAIEKCPTAKGKAYIRKNLTNNTGEWAHWARVFSPLLLQVNISPF